MSEFEVPVQMDISLMVKVTAKSKADAYAKACEIVKAWPTFNPPPHLQEAMVDTVIAADGDLDTIIEVWG